MWGLERELFVLCDKSLQEDWDHYTPEVVFITEFALACVIGFAILIMFGWHLWSVGRGETSVEAQDNDQYRRIARSRGKVRGSAITRRSRLTRPEGICELV